MNITTDLPNGNIFYADEIDSFLKETKLVTFNFVSFPKDKIHCETLEYPFSLPKDVNFLAVDYSGKVSIYKNRPVEFVYKDLPKSWDIDEYDDPFADIFKITDVDIPELILVEIVENADYYTIHLN